MTLLIDPPDVPGHGRLWSHLVSDTSFEELHVFARSLGIPERGFDRDHYDIPAERYESVVAAGAVAVSSRELISRLRAAGLRRRKSEVLGTGRPGRALVRPARLRAGDRVAVVATSGRVPAVRLDAGLAVLGAWGLEVEVGKHVRDADSDLPYLAAPDAARAADLMAAWLDQDVAGVVCARGGYGAQRVVDLLDWDALAQAGPKVLVGFSDVTALHQAFAARLGIATVHAPVVTQLADCDDDAQDHLRRTLLDPATATALADGLHVLVPGEAEGPLVGGNLAVLAAGIGAPAAMPAYGSLAFLEDVGEDPYRLDRLLTQLRRGGWLAGLRGVVLGHFTDCGPADEVRTVVLDRLGDLGVPVVAGAPFGHEAANRALPLGVPASLIAPAGGAGSLTLAVPALR
jgi:muramoyltetrapeptide carboxypeptidase